MTPDSPAAWSAPLEVDPERSFAQALECRRQNHSFLALAGPFAASAHDTDVRPQRGPRVAVRCALEAHAGIRAEAKRNPRPIESYFSCMRFR